MSFNEFSGGAGTDTFVFNYSSAATQSTIGDFTAGSGTGYVSAYGLQSIDDVLANATDTSAGCVIQLDDANVLTLQNVLKSALVADNFILAH